MLASLRDHVGANFVTDVMPKFPLMSFAKHVDFVLKVGLATSG